MTDLVTFLRARLDEDEAAAKAAADADSGGNWRSRSRRDQSRASSGTWESSLTDRVWDRDDPGDHCEESRQPSRAAGQHIARHDIAEFAGDVTSGEMQRMLPHPCCQSSILA